MQPVEIVLHHDTVRDNSGCIDAHTQVSCVSDGPVAPSARRAANPTRSARLPPPPRCAERDFLQGPSWKCRAFFHSGCSAVGQTPPSRLGAVLKCYKDAAQQMRGIWIIEIAELDAISRAEVSRIKAAS